MTTNVSVAREAGAPIAVGELGWLRLTWEAGVPNIQADLSLPPGNVAWTARFPGCDSLLCPRVSWDGRTLYVATDPLGYSPLCYSHGSDTLTVATSVTQVRRLCGPQPFDADALAVFVRLGFFLGEDTPFKTIRAFPAGGVLACTAEGVSLTAAPFALAPTARTAAEAVEGYAHYSVPAIRRRFPEAPAVIALSGGHDSRLVLLGLHELQAPIRYCVTAGDRAAADCNPDVYLAQLLTQRLRLEHRFVTAQRPWMDYDWDKNEVTGFCALEHTWLMPLAERLHADATPLYEGTGVEVFTRTDLLADEYVSLYEQGRYPDLAQQMFALWVGPPEELLAGLPRSAPWGVLRRDVAIERVAAALASYRDHPNPVGAFNFWNKNRRMTALCPIRHLTTRPRLHAPQLDIDLVRFVGGIPTAVVREREPQAAAIRERFPALADIPFNKEIHLAGRPKRGSLLPQTMLDRLARCARRAPHWLLPALRAQLTRRFAGRDAARMLNVIGYLSQLEYFDRTA